MSTNIGDSGSLALDTCQIGQSILWPSLSDISFSSMLQGATDTLSPGDFVNAPSIDDTDTYQS